MSERNEHRRENQAHPPAPPHDSERVGRVGRPQRKPHCAIRNGLPRTKKPLLNQIAEALRVSPLALSDGGNGPANDILEQLFWLDEEQPGVIKLVPTERGTARYNANPDLALHYDDNDNWPPRSPVAMWFDDTILDDFLKDWAAVQKKLYAGEITQAEYFEWKVMWPDE